LPIVGSLLGVRPSKRLGGYKVGAFSVIYRSVGTCGHRHQVHRPFIDRSTPLNAQGE
jgi:hypothetical protein